MNSPFRTTYRWGMTLIACCAMCGCKGGIVPALGDIAGPSHIGRQSTVEYSINLASGTGATYLWSCNPPGGGQFSEPTSQRTKFTPIWVDTDTSVEIIVVVTTDQFGAVIKKKKITILTRTGWALSWGGNHVEIPYAIETDANGDVYVGGIFNETVDFDPGPGFDIYTANGHRDDAFLSKFGSNGEHHWTYTLGDTGRDSIFGLEIDNYGNVFVAGLFEGTVDLDPGPAVDEHTSSSSGNAFLCKFYPDGEYIWGYVLGKESYSLIKGITTDSYGNLYITGAFRGTVDFDLGQGIEEHTTGSGAGTKYFIASYDTNIELIWVKIWDKGSAVAGSEIAIDDTGSIYILGDFFSTADFDPGPGIDQHTAGFGRDAFLCKLNHEGNFEWVRVWHLGYYDWGEGIEFDESGNIYVSGTVRYGGGDVVFGATSYPGLSEFGGYLRKFDPNGASLWYQIFTEDNAGRCNGIAMDASGNILMTGIFESTVDLDPGPGNAMHTSQGGGDNYVSSFNQDGVFQWSRTFPGEGSAFGGGIAASPSGDIYVAGYFSLTIDLDPGPETNMHTGQGNYDVFLVKLLPDGYW